MKESLQNKTKYEMNNFQHWFTDTLWTHFVKINILPASRVYSKVLLNIYVIFYTFLYTLQNFNIICTGTYDGSSSFRHQAINSTNAYFLTDQK